ncbi:MAG: c-type cytochrome biogenesis protein CcmI [Parvularculaceae bacterium]
MIWVLLTALMGLAAAFAAAPFLRSTVAASGKDVRSAIFKRQLDEVERDLSNGLISAPEAAALRVEAQRRLINAAADDEQGEFAMTPSRPWSAIIVASVVIFAGVALYAIKGVPQAVSATRPSAKDSPETARPEMTSAGQSVGSVDEMIEKLRARLEENPEDDDGWRMLGWSYFNMARFRDAADAYKRACDLQPRNASYQSAYGEALVMSAAGFVTAEAKRAFDAAISVDPAEPRARYFRGLALDQAGDAAGAISAWIEMVNTAPADAEWASDLTRRIIERAAEAGVDIAGRLKPSTAASMPGPSAEQVNAAMTMPDADRQAMIRGMVSRLANRLKDQPKDADGWIRLIRSRMALGEREQAQADFQSALAAFSEDASERERIRKAAETLGALAP